MTGLYEVVSRVERVVFTELLDQRDGNISRAAAILGISRSTLRGKLATLGIVLDRSVRLNNSSSEGSSDSQES